MAVWWLLGRAGPAPRRSRRSRWRSTSRAALLTAALLRALRRPAAVAIGAGALMFLAPQNLDAAYWFSASTDLFATSSCSRRWWRPRGAGCSLRPPLRSPPICRRSRPTSYRCSPAGAAGCPGGAGSPTDRAAGCAARRGAGRAGGVLHGWGGAGDTRAALAGKLLQIAKGFTHVFTGEGVVPERWPSPGRRDRRARRLWRGPGGRAAARAGRPLAAARVLRARGGSAVRGRLGGRRALLLSSGGGAGLGGGGGAGDGRHGGPGRLAAVPLFLGGAAGSRSAARTSYVRSAGRGGPAGGRRRVAAGHRVFDMMSGIRTSTWR